MGIISVLLVVIHVVACLILIAVILLQAGRGGGLVSNFSISESLFGTQTNVFLQKATTVAAVVFMLTCLGLAFMNAQKSKSLVARPGVLDEMVPTQEEAEDMVDTLPAEEQAPQEIPQESSE